MNMMGFRSNFVAFNCLIDCFCKLGHIDQAIELSELMEEKDSITYNTMANNLCKAGRFGWASKLITACLRDGIRIPQRTQRAVLNGIRNSRPAPVVVVLPTVYLRSPLAVSSSSAATTISGLLQLSQPILLHSRGHHRRSQPWRQRTSSVARDPCFLATSPPLLPSRHLALIHRLRPLVGGLSAVGRLSPSTAACCCATHTKSFSRRVSDRVPKNPPPTVPPGCDFNHWFILIGTSAG
ncbi:hypothetical protein FEM48_Zijuj08G0087800 [Ziziphus jujuba var. spinosa]|uniref:Pentatricopeptide repeat-containing protein n=1 Tax=Ziziphus jujuba var. spinosa TaxID=714518 RepID=A0A978UY46_ZIZJJ|nr:hypothetical protein FEM48_Zijuj08G0087800 [Ziziphus jujuba var. spinosa]